MLSRSKYVFLVLMILAGVTGCKTEVDDKTAAEVSAPKSTAGAAADASSTSVDTTFAVAPESVTPVNKEKSKIGFVGAKVTGQHVGEIPKFDGRIEYNDGVPVRVMFEMDLPSLTTDTEKLTGHLKSADFFDAQKYPKGTFVSTSIEPAPKKNVTGKVTHKLTGDLNLRGVTKSISFPATIEVTPNELNAKAEFTINRHDWGISYKGAPDDLIRDNVLIKLNLYFPPPPRV